MIMINTKFKITVNQEQDMLQRTIQRFKFTGNILFLNLRDGYMGVYIILYNSWVSTTFNNYLSTTEQRVQSYFRKPSF